MDFFDGPYFQINKFFLYVIGQWPYLSLSRKRCTQFLVTIALFSCLLPSLKILLERIKSDWQVWSFGDENAILTSHAEHGRSYTILYAGCVTGTTITYAAMTLTPQILNIILPLNQTRPRKLPFPLEYFVDKNEYFYWIELHVFITATIEMFVLIASESIFAVFTEHACGLFKIVGYRLKTIKNVYNSKTNSKEDAEEATYKIITLCIEQHNRAIEFCDTIESCFSICFFFTMGLNSVIISATLLQVVVNMNKLNDAVKFATFSIALIIHLYFNSLPAQRLMDNSVFLADLMYDGFWYQLPLKPKKLLSMIFIRTTAPCTLTAGNICVMSLKTFCKILQTRIVNIYQRISGFLKVWGDSDKMIECLPTIFTGIGCLVYCIIYLSKQKKLSQLFYEIKRDWEFWTSDRERLIILSHASHGRIYTIFYTGCISGTLLTYLIMAVIPQFLDIVLPLNETRPKKLPFQMYYFVNYSEDYFYWIMLHISFNAVLEMCILIGSESILAVFTEHACALFKIIGVQLKKINNHESERKNLRTVIFCIEQHNRAIEFCSIIESLFSPCFFFIMGLNTILISASLIQVVVNLNKFDIAVRFGAFTGASIAHLFLNSLPAQRLMDSSAGLVNNLYDSSWHQMPVKLRKLLLLIMMRSRNPCKLTAGKMLDLSLRSVCSVRI
ncbi:uncharacterized protein LOC122498378 [Leptopilina heterotoma]|uniref:uncharacterized protein LOC122498378 n=1 Tax=Leptopilina heterotoma TaxID=63436 RepID=UPI001CA9DFA7|nr:uncharacterized protein LOC122498378 [Leptopilina heterotoma]